MDGREVTPLLTAGTWVIVRDTSLWGPQHTRGRIIRVNTCSPWPIVVAFSHCGCARTATPSTGGTIGYNPEHVIRFAPDEIEAT